ncbi:MAG: ATP-binding protein [Sphaerochaeta sp.]
MILEYSVKNYKVFKETAHLSFIASNYDKETLEKENVQYVDEKNLRVLKSAVVYGANASGKTKLFESLAFFKRFVLESSKESQQGEKIDIQPFLLCETTKDEPSEFEIVFSYQKALYRYGFEVTSEKVLAEWLFYKPKSREYQIFYRDSEEKTLESHPKFFKKGAMLHSESMVRDNALMLSVAAQFNDEICSNVLNWFTHGLSIVSSLRENGYKGYTMMKNDQDGFHEKLMNLMKVADFSIQDIQSKVLTTNEISEHTPPELKEFLMNKIQNEHAVIYTKCETIHHVYDKLNQVVGKTSFSLDEDESHGTQKFFYLAGPILNTLEMGKTLFIDEFDARLHPNLVIKLYSLFNDPTINKTGAQLIITAQNSIFLQSGLLRKDQIWFVEKDRFEAAHLYSLAEFKSVQVRKSENFETNYLNGKYGAIPYLNLLTHFNEEACEQEKPWPPEK